MNLAKRLWSLVLAPTSLNSEASTAHPSTIGHLLPHRSTFSPTSLLPHEHLLPPTRTCCLPRVPVASYENLLPTRTCCLYPPPQFRDLFEEISMSKDAL